MTAPDALLPAPRLGSRELFPRLAPRSYLNHAGVSPPSLAVERAVGSLLDVYARTGALGVNAALAIRARLRDRVARLLGARAEDVALTSGVSHGIQAVALSFPWRAGDRVVLFEGEFPANVTPWLRAAAIPAAGVVPRDVGSLGVDYLAGGAHKWLLGAEGAGYLWVRSERLPALRPALAGWLSHEDGLGFLGEGRPGLLRYDRPLRRRADVFEGSSAASLAQAALDASLGLLLELGVPAIHAHVQGLHDRLEPVLRARGLEPLRESGPARRSGILAARPPPGRDVRALRDALAARGVAVAIPDGLLRLAPHWPNGAGEVDVVAEALDAALGGGASSAHPP